MIKRSSRFLNDSKIFSVTSLSLAVIFLILVPTHYAAAVSLNFGFSSYSTGDSQVGTSPVQITYDDQLNATWQNGSIDTINVNVVSTTDPQGITLALLEVDPISGLPAPDSGFFRNTNLIFTNGNNRFPMTGVVTISISNAQANSSSTSIDQLPISVISNSSNTLGDPGLLLNLNETGVNTGLFTGKIGFTNGPSSGNLLHAVPGDEITVSDFVSGLVTNGLIIPNPRNDVGTIQVNAGDNLTASFGGLVTTVSIQGQTGEGGGGGGGFIRPGLVLDVVLGAIGGSPYIVSPPSFGGGYYHFSDGLTLVQGTNKTIFDISKYNQEIPKQVMTSGEKVSMTFKTFESYNLEGVVHMGLYLIPRGAEDMITTNSIASIVYDNGSPVEVIDPNHILANSLASTTSDGKFQYTQFSFTPTKSYDKMSFLVRAWNDHMYSTDARIYDAVDTQKVVKTLPAGVVLYKNFNDLEATLENEGFYKPGIMAHIHDTSAVFNGNQAGSVCWLYDTINHTVTMVISDNNDNELASAKAILQPYEVEKKGDYTFMTFTSEQLNRWNEDQEQRTMGIEAAKAMFMAAENGLLGHRNW